MCLVESECECEEKYCINKQLFSVSYKRCNTGYDESR